MENVTVISHPLVEHGLAKLRDEATQPAEFRRTLGEVTSLIVCEATRDFELKPARVRTPLTAAPVKRLRHEVLLVPILRAGLGMLQPALNLLPEAKVGMIGLKRDEATLAPVTYQESLPESLEAFEVMVLDPMLATGGSAVAALELLYARGARRVRLVHLLAAPEGIRRVRSRYPDLPVFVAALDRRLNEKGYIVPGLGDAGDRQFGV